MFNFFLRRYEREKRPLLLAEFLLQERPDVNPFVQLSVAIDRGAEREANHQGIRQPFVPEERTEETSRHRGGKDGEKQPELAEENKTVAPVREIGAH